MLPWVAISRTDEGRPDHRSSVATDAAAIESVSSIELVASDRPTASPLAKRTDGPRLLSIVPADRLGVEPASSFTWLAWRSGSIGWSEPIALHLAGRGPPLIAGV